MYPLILKPPVKDYLWGGNKLKTEFNIESDKEITAEGWMLSCHKDGESIISNGEFKGETLSYALSIMGDKALGKNCAAYNDFPILIKLIDAKQKLSVQVHPDDEYALRVEGEFGKNEMWYIVDCEKGAKLIYGFNRELDKDEFETRIKNNTLEEVCNYVEVKKGDVFFISAGTLHAIGEGILIAEVQQSSNSTYRVSDYGRLDAFGNPRPLHIEKALDVTTLTPPTLPYGAIGETHTFDFGSERELANCEFFKAKLITLNGTKKIFCPDSFVSLVILDGDVVIKYGQDKLCCKKGESIFIPAGLNVEISGNAELLCSYI